MNNVSMFLTVPGVECSARRDVAGCNFGFRAPRKASDAAHPLRAKLPNSHGCDTSCHRSKRHFFRFSFDWAIVTVSGISSFNSVVSLPAARQLRECGSEAGWRASYTSNCAHDGRACAPLPL